MRRVLPAFGAPLSPLCGQKGALFGIDARIALALFGILSVVAGFVAFGRIASSKEAVLIAELEAFETAFRQYQTDMGTFYLFTLNKPINDDSSLEDIQALWAKEKVKDGFADHWHGPYLHRDTRKSRFWGNYSVFYAQPDRKNTCTVDSACNIFLSLSQVPEDMWVKINAHFDETNRREEAEYRGEEISSGRIQADGATDPRTLIFRMEGRPEGGSVLGGP